ncbi:MAG: transposase [Planctomycetes bacterium]|nr:transposase [Planctomycetota bacterium]
MQQRAGTKSRERKRSAKPSGTKRRRPARDKQTELFAHTWGGARKGAGRKPKGELALVSHAARERLASRHPVHVTTRLLPGLPSLRRSEELRTLLHALRAAQDHLGMRVVHFSIQTNHLHLLVEARGRDSLALGIKALLVRIARALNRLWMRTGKLFSDRYHARTLRTPAEVRRALVYVLQNARKHGLPLSGVDAYSSAAWFEGWRESARERTRREEILRRLERLLRLPADPPPRVRRPSSSHATPGSANPGSANPGGATPGSATPGSASSLPQVDRIRIEPHTWLLAQGWRRAGRIGVWELPRIPAAPASRLARGSSRT